MTQDLYRARIRAPEHGRPLVLALHGTGGDEDQFFGLAQELMPGAGVISPRGDVSEHGAARFFRRTAEGVYDMQDLARATARMTDFLESWKAIYPDSPVFGFGYSNGANILASVLMTQPDMVDRAALLHPLIPWTPEPVAALVGKRVLVTAGLHDPICPPDRTAALIDWFGAQSAEVSQHVHDGGHELRSTEVKALQEFLEAENQVSPGALS